MPVVVAAQFNAVELLLHILPQCKATKDALDWALQNACASAAPEAIRMLINAGANINVTTSGGIRRSYRSQVEDMDQ